MSKLLIPASGQASKKLTGYGRGGLVMSPGAKIQNCKYEVMYGCALGQSLLDGGNDETGDASLDVNILTFPASQNMLYQTNNAAATAARATKHVDTGKGLILAIAAEDYEFAPYYQVLADATNASPADTNFNVFSVGNNDGFYVKATLQSADVSALTRLFVGFIKVEGHRPSMDNYDEAYGLQIVGGTNPATVLELAILNAAATVETDSTLTLADATNVTFEIQVSTAGVCSAFINGAPAPAVLGMTFDASELVYPAIHLVGTGASTLALSAFEFGPLSAIT